MSLPQVVSREQWLAARTALLAREKEMTRARDALNTTRRELPMVRVDTPYAFQGPDGEVGLADLFDGRRQLIVQHFMFDPEWTDGCTSCTAAVDEHSAGLDRHLAARDTSFAMVSRAPLAKLEDYASRRGWTVPWYSSYGSDFNYDFHVTLDPSVAPPVYNYREFDMEAGESHEMPGASCFLRDGDDVFHTYSMFARGTETLGGAYAFLDLTPLGRQEQWEKPEGRADGARAAMPNFAE
jgi:predicted dithiol-disulfide oxidoreductase (DUF899 family)